ncbi:MAG TPA: thioredoxin domain-containing protein [Ardenticatenaceae bacterium]|jgi:protein-disulfide isomerase
MVNRSHPVRLLLALVLVALLSACGQRVVYVTVTPTPDPAGASVPLPPASDTASGTTNDTATGTGSAPAPATGQNTAPVDAAPGAASAALSASAGRVAFMGPFGQGGPLHAFVANADGTGLTAVSQEQGEGYFPYLSPDGTQVAFVTNTTVDAEIYVADVATGEATNLTNTPGNDTQPIWSPDGSQIAFVSNRGGGDINIWVMNADGSDPRLVVHTPGEDKLGSWSPDSKYIVYSNVNEVGESLWVMDVASGETSPLTEQSGGGTDSAPAWSPDGQAIAFYSASGSQPSQIFTVAPDGSNRQQLTNGTTSAIVPTWSPDGNWLLYTSIAGENRYDIVALNLQTQQSTVVPNVQGFATSWAAASQPLAETGFTQGPAQSGVEVDPAVLEKAYYVGDPNAPITIVEFSDYQCPFCKRWVDETLPQIGPLIEDGTVRLFYVDFPLTIHAQAPAAAEAARCAGELGGPEGYWTMHDALFANMEQWSQPNPNPAFAEIASGVGLDGAALQECVESGRYTADVQAGIAEGTRLGITGTPTFFINGTRVVGAIPFEEFQQYLTPGGQ